jgi:hypothetical protein
LADVVLNRTTNTCRRPSASQGAQRPPGRGLAAAAGYTCTLSLVGTLGADLPCGERSRRHVLVVSHYAGAARGMWLP